jgi:hypothetical protein
LTKASSKPSAEVYTWTSVEVGVVSSPQNDAATEYRPALGATKRNTAVSPDGPGWPGSVFGAAIAAGEQQLQPEGPALAMTLTSIYSLRRYKAGSAGIIIVQREKTVEWKAVAIHPLML